VSGRITGPTAGALILFVVAVLLVVAGTAYAVLEGQRRAQGVAQEARALCAEQAVIGTVPVAASTGKVSVQLVIDFRDAYAGLGCTPALPPPSAELRRLAAKYGIPLRS
jgi:hypothetical protein